jgi:hypothetical protein
MKSEGLCCCRRRCFVVLGSSDLCIQQIKLCLRDFLFPKTPTSVTGFQVIFYCLLISWTFFLLLFLFLIFTSILLLFLFHVCPCLLSFFVPGDRGDDDGGDYVIVICGLFFL